MSSPQTLLFIGLVLYLVSLPLLWAWAVMKETPPEEGDWDRQTLLQWWWKQRQMVLLVAFGPLLVLAGLYLLLEWVQ